MNDKKRSGHGHVTPRADGVRARCGGPAFCSVCQKERAALPEPAQAAPAADAVPVVAWEWIDERDGLKVSHNEPADYEMPHQLEALIHRSGHLAAMEALRHELEMRLRYVDTLESQIEALRADRSTQVAEVMHAVDEFSVAAGMSAIGVSEGVVRGSPDHAILEQRFNRKREAVEAAVRKLAEGA